MTLHIVTCLNNPLGYESRWRLYQRFVSETIWAAPVSLTTVELLYGDQTSRVATLIDNVSKERGYLPFAFKHIQVRTRSVLWSKENLLNIGFASLPEHWEYGAWIDADIGFHNPNWAEATVNALQTRDVVQMWAQAVDLCPQHQCASAKVATSFMYAWRHGLTSRNNRYDDLNWHPGYAWAIRRDAYAKLGGLIDFAVLGAGDRHMAMALVGKAEQSMPGGLTANYQQSVLAWQRRADYHIAENVDYVPGLITHWWHGRKRQRGYQSRWKILERHQYDPVTDIRRDPTSYGLIEWSDARDQRMRRLRDDVIRYFGSRNEDSIDVE